MLGGSCSTDPWSLRSSGSEGAVGADESARRTTIKIHYLPHHDSSTVRGSDGHDLSQRAADARRRRSFFPWETTGARVAELPSAAVARECPVVPVECGIRPLGR